MPKHRIPEAQRYRGPVKWVQYICARILILGLVHLPIGVAFRSGRIVGWLCWRLLRTRRALVRKNLEVVNSWMSCREESGSSAKDLFDGLALEDQVKEVFMRSGANLLSGFTFSRMSVSQVEAHLEVEGLEHLRSALVDGRGAIIILAHMGPWEALVHLPGLAARQGVDSPLAALYRPLNNRYLDDWYKGQRERAGTRLFSRRDGFHKPVDFLRSGGVLGILADQKMRQGELVDFFGRPCRTNPLPGLFQRRSGVDVVGLSISTIGHCRWRLKVQVVDFAAVAEDRTRSSEARISNHCLEQMLTTSPLDVFWFHKRFH